ncbi:MAG: hypothetical protein R2698_07770 [Microthrixaceae bacterium]
MKIAERRASLEIAALTGLVGLAQLWWSWEPLHRQITTDESFTYFAVNGGLRDLAGACRADPAMSIYYAATFVWARLVPDSIVGLRVATFLFFVAVIALVCTVARRHRRWWAAPLALAALGTAPIIREAVVDARAAVPAALCGVVLMLVLGRLTSTEPGRKTGRLAAAVAVLVAVTAFTHPSGLGPAGVAWLWASWLVWRRGSRGRLWLAGALGAILLALAANVVQVQSADGLVKGGLAGAHQTASLLWGANTVLAVVTIVGVATVVAFDGRRSTVTAAATVSSVGWTTAMLLAVPLVTLFVARYLVVACVMLALAAVAVTARQWRRGLLGVVAIACIAGGLVAHDRAPGAPSRWCDVAADLDGHVRRGDVVVFPNGPSITPVMACLGETRTARLLDRARTLPQLTWLDRSNPRTVWRLTLDPTADIALHALAVSDATSRVVLVRTDVRRDGLDGFVETVSRHGGTCVERIRAERGITVCTPGD